MEQTLGMDLILARAIHVFAVVLWIGGVAFVTTILFPAVRRTEPPQQRLAAFLLFEARFAPQARITVALAGVSGLYLVIDLQAWDRFTSLHFWWMHAMVGLWLVFALMLFIIEPFVLHPRLAEPLENPDSGQIFDRMERLHRILLGLSLISLLGAVAGSHGL